MPVPDIRPLSKAETLGALPDLCDTLSDCVEGGASLGFMSPFAPVDGEAFWRGVAEAVGRGEVLLYGAFLGDRLVGTGLRLRAGLHEPLRAVAGPDGLVRIGLRFDQLCLDLFEAGACLGE